MLSERLIKEDILTSLFVKKHVVVRHNTKYGEEKFVSTLPYSKKRKRDTASIPLSFMKHEGQFLAFA